MTQIRRLINPFIVLLICYLALFSVAEAGTRSLTAQLSAANEVPPASSNATGEAILELNERTSTVCWEISGTNLSSPAIMAHIHRGPAGVNGPVVVTLFNGPTQLPAQGCVEGVSQALLKEIRQKPALFYVNVHTVRFPNGEMRGQLNR
jgi:hypothetical protein